MADSSYIAWDDEYSGASSPHYDGFNHFTSAPTDSCPASASAAADSAAAAAEEECSPVRSSPQRHSPNWDPWEDSDVGAVSVETGAAELNGSNKRRKLDTAILSTSNVENCKFYGNFENDNCQIKDSACDDQTKSLESRSALNYGEIAPITKSSQGAEIIKNENKNRNPSTPKRDNDRNSYRESKARDLGAANPEDKENSAWSYGQQAVPRRPIGILPERPSGASPRPVVIDGCNVAISATRGQAFDARALANVVDIVRKNGHEVRAVVPDIRKRKALSKSLKPTWNHYCLRQLSSQGALIWARPKDAKEADYDDFVVLKTAKKLDAAVISNDKYRDWLGHEDDFDMVIVNDVQRFSFKRGHFHLDRSEGEPRLESRFFRKDPDVQETRPPLAFSRLPSKRKMSYSWEDDDDDDDVKLPRWE